MKLSQLTQEQKLTYVGLLTEVQKDELIGQLYTQDSYFNPIQDFYNNWIISVEEMRATDIEWVKELELIEYKAKLTHSPF